MTHVVRSTVLVPALSFEPHFPTRLRLLADLRVHFAPIFAR